ncbi:MAG: polyketide cyclase [Verrucomicrobiaceae bacterium]|nr:polyketide cyclase [Verrucomicrobiaceae bacterium]
MFRKILIVLALAIAVFLVIASRQPDHFSTTRSATIQAPPATVFPLVNDFHKWEDWSPWAKLDPNAKNSFDGPTEGVGAGFGWSGNGDVGEGHMKITESKPAELIKIDLVFKRPMEGTNITVFTFKPEGTGTVVSWTMSGENNFLSKMVSVVMNCDKMMGDWFEKGLASMKAKAEATPKA